MTEPTRDFLFCAAVLLDQGRHLDRLSRPLTAAALIGVLVYPSIIGRPWMLVGFAMLVALAGVAETYFAIRVNFDAALFHQVAIAPETPDFTGTDAALRRLGVAPVTTTGRPAEARVAGAKRLFLFQTLALVAQVLSILAGACIVLVWR
jgi:hypothetical protein